MTCKVRDYNRETAMREIKLGAGFVVGKDGKKVQRGVKHLNVSKRLQMKASKRVRVGKR